jgi:hypothetical protein
MPTGSCQYFAKNINEGSLYDCLGQKSGNSAQVYERILLQQFFLSKSDDQRNECSVSNRENFEDLMNIRNFLTRDIQ